MQADNISGLASDAKNIFVASTIYCTDAIKEALGNLASTDCIWELEYGDSKALALTKVSQSNYTLSTLAAYSRSGMVDVHFIVNVTTPVNTWTNVATLPAGYYPPVKVYMDVPYFDASVGYAHLRLCITETGDI